MKPLKTNLFRIISDVSDTVNPLQSIDGQNWDIKTINCVLMLHYIFGRILALRQIPQNNVYWDFSREFMPRKRNYRTTSLKTKT